MRHREWRVIPWHVILSQATRVFQVSSFVALLSQPLKIGWIGAWFNLTFPELRLTYTRMKALGYPQLPRVSLLMVHLAFLVASLKRKHWPFPSRLAFLGTLPTNWKPVAFVSVPCLERVRERHVPCSNSGKKTWVKKVIFFLILLTLLFLCAFQEIWSKKDNPEGNSNNPY